MATFKVGQRVRVRQEVRALCVTNHSMHAGKEGVITRLNTEFDLRFGAFHELDIRHIDGFPIRVAEDYLEPLTDPGADAFIERIKKLKPYDEPKVMEPYVVNWQALDVFADPATCSHQWQDCYPLHGEVQTYCGKCCIAGPTRLQAPK